MNIKKIMGSLALGVAVAGSGASMASTASADTTPYVAPDYGSDLSNLRTVALQNAPSMLTPKYVHNAYSGGYATAATCKTYLDGVENALSNDTYGEAGCYQLPSGNWTYGSIGFNISSTSDLAKVSGYTAYKPVSNVHYHNSSGFNSETACVAQETADLAAIRKAGGTVLQAPGCSLVSDIVDYNEPVPWTFGYGGITYSTPKGNAVFSGDSTQKTPYFIYEYGTDTNGNNFTGDNKSYADDSMVAATPLTYTPPAS